MLAVWFVHLEDIVFLVVLWEAAISYDTSFVFFDFAHDRVVEEAIEEGRCRWMSPKWKFGRSGVVGEFRISSPVNKIHADQL